jgi:hypothetical protein
MPKTPVETDKSIAVRIKVSRYKLIEELIADMVAKNPILRGAITPERLIRSIIDDRLVKEGKLKAKEL